MSSQTRSESPGTPAVTISTISNPAAPIKYPFIINHIEGPLFFEPTLSPVVAICGPPIGKARQGLVWIQQHSQYLRQVVTGLPQADTVEAIENLMPCELKKIGEETG